MSDSMYDIVVVGGGPAGLAVAISAAFEGLSTCVVDRNPEGFGGAIGQTALIENLPGFPEGITGPELAARLIAHAIKNGAELIGPENIVDIARKDAGSFSVTFDGGGKLSARTVVLATGVQPVRLDAHGVSEFLRCGVSYYPPPTNGFYKDQEFHIVGGGNSAAIAANFLSEHEGCSVNMLVRADTVTRTMSKVLIDKLEAKKPNVRFHYNTSVVGAEGKGKLEKIVLKNPSGLTTVPSHGLYVFIGTQPKTEWLNGKGIVRDPKGFLLTGYDIPIGALGAAIKPIEYQTSWPGVFAIGTGRMGCSPRAASATGEGAQIVKAILEYLTHT